MIDILKIIKTKMNELNIPYQFGEYVAEQIPEVFWVGTYSEEPITTEDSKREFTFKLTGCSEVGYEVLETQKELIYGVFQDFIQKVNNKGIVVNYDNAFPVDTGVNEFKRIQINLNIQEWGIN